MQKLRKRNWQGIIYQYALTMLETVIFDHLFYKKQYLSNGQANCREISHKHCK